MPTAAATLSLFDMNEFQEMEERSYQLKQAAHISSPTQQPTIKQLYSSASAFFIHMLNYELSMFVKVTV